MNPFVVIWMVYSFAVLVLVLFLRPWRWRGIFGVWIPILLFVPNFVLLALPEQSRQYELFGGPLALLGMLMGPPLLYLIIYFFLGPGRDARLPTLHELYDTVILFGEFILFLLLTSKGGWKIIFALFGEMYSRHAVTASGAATAIFLLAVVLDIMFMFFGISPFMTEEKAKEKDDNFIQLYFLKQRVMAALIFAWFAAMFLHFFL